jgi:hypothetical protein
VAIPEAIARKLLVHPDVWIDVTDTEPEPVTTSAGATFSGDRGDQIITAIGLMDEDDGAHFTVKTGKPNLEIIESILGYEVNPAERDEAWDRIVQSRAEETHGDAEGYVATPSIDAG